MRTPTPVTSTLYAPLASRNNLVIRDAAQATPKNDDSAGRLPASRQGPAPGGSFRLSTAGGRSKPRCLRGI
jgi:hypothetical protein